MRYLGQSQNPKTAYQIFKQDPDIIRQVEQHTEHITQGRIRQKVKTEVFKSIWERIHDDAAHLKKYVSAAEADDERYEIEMALFRVRQRNFDQTLHGPSPVSQEFEMGVLPESTRHESICMDVPVDAQGYMEMDDAPGNSRNIGCTDLCGADATVVAEDEQSALDLIEDLNDPFSDFAVKGEIASLQDAYMVHDFIDSLEK